MSEEKIKEIKNKNKTSKKKKRLRLTILLIVILAVVLAGGIFSLHALRSTSNLTLVMPYAQADISYQKTSTMSLDIAAGFSSNLCVGSDNQSLDDVSLEGSECGALFSLNDKNILFSKNMYQKIYPASITKLMTALLAFKYGNLDDIITITTEDITLEDGSQKLGLQAGDQVVLRDLLEAMLVYSGNDAAQAIARHVSGSVQDFVDLMNTEATSLGAVNTHFVNPTGLHDDDHYTSVYDIYLMLNAISKYQEFYNMAHNAYYVLSYTGADGTEISKRFDSTDYYLTGNHAVPQNVSVLGGKTGTTSKAGSCLALISQNAYGEVYISIIVKAQNKEYLYQDMDELLSQINM